MSPLSASSEKRRTWSLPKRLAIAGPIAAAAIVVADIVAWNQDCWGCPSWWIVSGTLLLTVLLIGALLLGIVILNVALRLARRRARILPGLVTTGIAITAAMCAAAPVRADWYDGCNWHWATMPLVAAPHVWLGSPEGARLAYEDASTLKRCLL